MRQTESAVCLIIANAPPHTVRKPLRSKRAERTSVYAHKVVEAAALSDARSLRQEVRTSCKRTKLSREYGA